MSTPALRVIAMGLEKQTAHLQLLIDGGAPTVQDLRDIMAEQQRFLELAMSAMEPAPDPETVEVNLGALGRFGEAPPQEIVHSAPAQPAPVGIKGPWYRFGR